MQKTYVVNVVGHVIVSADEEEQAIEMVKQRMGKLNQFGGNSGFRVESAVEMISLPKK